MDDSVKDRLARLFRVGEPRAAGQGEVQPGEVFRGVGWIVSEDAAGLTLHYLSGEIGGRENRLRITREDAEALRDGQRLDDILIAHGRG